MPAKSAIVVVIDGLGAGWIGPYGNTWIETPGLNQLAAQSAIVETAIADSLDLQGAYRAYWSGRHALAGAPSTDVSLPDLAAGAGARTILVTDEPLVAAHSLGEQFAKRKLLEPSSPRACAKDPAETALYRVFSAAAEELADCVEPSLLWVHAQGMTGPWDAPLEFRNQFADEDDPPPPTFAQAPSRILAADCDPDEMLGLSQACAGQVVLLDLCLDMLVAALDAHSFLKDSLLVVTSPRGYPLGEHLQVGHGQMALYGESLHIPLLLRLPNQQAALARLRRIAQPHELHGLIAELCAWPAPTLRSAILAELSADTGHAARAAYSVAPGQRSIRTPAWFLRESVSDEQTHYELFAKPDDRWEANEVSGRCSEAVELLAARMNEFASSTRLNPPTELPPLADLLCDVWR